MSLDKDFLQRYEELMSEDVEEALAFCLKTLEEREDSDLYVHIGECYSYLNDFERAVQYIDKAIGCGCSNVNLAKSIKGEALFYLDKFKESKDVFNDLLKANPNSFFAIAYLTDIDIQLGNIEEGVERAQSVLNKNILSPTDAAHIYTNLGWINLKYSNKPDEAVENFNKAIVLDPNGGAAYTGIAEYYLSNNQYLEALESFQKAMDLDENTIQVYFGIGLCYKGLNKLEDALEYFKIVRDADPSHEKVHEEIISIER